MIFRKDRKDRERSEVIAASRIRSIGLSATPLANSDPEEVNRRLRNLSYGSTNSKVVAGRGENHQILRSEAVAAG